MPAITLLSTVEEYDCMPVHTFCCASISCLLSDTSTGRFYCEQHSESVEEMRKEEEPDDLSKGVKVWTIAKLIMLLSVLLNPLY